MDVFIYKVPINVKKTMYVTNKFYDSDIHPINGWIAIASS